MKWHPPSKGQADSLARRQRNLAQYIMRRLEDDIAHRLLNSTQARVELEPWERTYLESILADTPSWQQGTRERIQKRLAS
jgi:hypothetical protein